MKKTTKIIIGVLLVLLICTPIVNEMIQNRKVKEISYSNYSTIIDESKNYNFTLIYIGEDNKDYKKTLRELINKNKPVDKTTSNVYFINKSKLKEDELNELVGTNDFKDAYLFISNSKVVKTVTGKLSTDKLEAYIKEFVSLGIDESIQKYIVPNSAEDYINAMNSDKTTMAVFGRDTCFYCNKFKLIYNTVAEENDVNIYYFSSESSKDHINSKAYPSKEYKKLMALDITVPASCSTTKQDAKIGEGFRTPFTIFTKNGVVLDTICGYIDKEELIEKMQRVGMLNIE